MDSPFIKQTVGNYSGVSTKGAIRSVYTHLCADPEGDRGFRSPPPRKSQVTWVSTGNKQLKKLDNFWNLVKV